MTKSNLKEKQENTTNFKGLLIKKIQMQENKALIILQDEDDFKKQNGNFAVKDEVTEKFSSLWENAKTIITALIPQLHKEITAMRLNWIGFEYDNNGYLSNVNFSVVWKFDSNNHILNLNIPKIPIYKPEMSESTIAISGKHEELLQEILQAAKDYMKGDTRTKQMKLIVDNTN